MTFCKCGLTAGCDLCKPPFCIIAWRPEHGGERKDDAIERLTAERDALLQENENLIYDSTLYDNTKAELVDKVKDRDQLREDYQYLTDCHSILQGAYATDSKTIKGLREEISDYKAEVQHRIAEREQLREKIDDYKSASLLEISGDPADIEPHHIENEITSLRKHLTTAREVIDMAEKACMWVCNTVYCAGGVYERFESCPDECSQKKFFEALAKLDDPNNPVNGSNYDTNTKLDADSTTNNSTNNEQDKATSVAKKHTRYHNGEWINDEVDR